MSRYLGNEMAVAWDRQPEHAAPATRDALSALSHRLMFDVTANAQAAPRYECSGCRPNPATRALLDVVPRIAEPDTRRTEAERRYDEARKTWEAYSSRVLLGSFILAFVQAADALREERRTR